MKILPRLAVACLAVAFLSLTPASQPARDLTFAQRVDAQRAIERVYYSHQIGATQPFEEAVSAALLEKKVHDYLKQSVALEKFWKTPITGEMLHRELERITSSTRYPERLREVFTALGNDAFLIEETFVRSELADRLAKSFVSGDGAIQSAVRERAEALRTELENGKLDPSVDSPARSVVTVAPDMEAASPSQPRGVRSQITAPGDATLKVSRQEFLGLRELPARVGDLIEGRDAFSLRTVLSKRADTLSLAMYQIPKIKWAEFLVENDKSLDESTVHAVSTAQGSAHISLDSDCPAQDSWSNSSLNAFPDPDAYHTSVWTGSLILVWGGAGHLPEGYGGWRYDPLIDSWSRISSLNEPISRGEHTAVWTGSEMIVWGGSALPVQSLTNTGGRYNPATDTWAPISMTGAPLARSGHTAVWTGTQMIVWGGKIGPSTSVTNTGGRYDPSTDTWSPTLANATAPQGRFAHTAVWTGSEMIVWGGNISPAGPGFLQSLQNGGRYDPATDSWSITAISPTARAEHSAIWTGSQMIIWGGILYSVDIAGRTSQTPLKTGARYDPSTNSWTATRADATAPLARGKHSAVWTGTRMIVWGGALNSSSGLGGQYDPVADAWSPVSFAGEPPGRYLHTAVWTGTRMVVWGGQGRSSYLNSGGRYDPVADTWTPTATGTVSQRTQHSAVWTGNLMIVWGGFDVMTNLTAGGDRYDPLLDTWSSTSMSGAPDARYLHTAVWTGSRMVIWGGHTFAFGLPPDFATGGRYNPTSDSWQPTSLTNAPLPRSFHSAVWTGSRMVVWGGYGGTDPNNPVSLQSGASYDPSGNNWQAIAEANAPTARYEHQAVWTGSEMLIWGGLDDLGNTPQAGGRYDASSNHWQAMSTANAPEGRIDFTAVWSGSRMIVWGGDNVVSNPAINTGGLYDPASDAWTSTNLGAAPEGRRLHTALWTGSRMLVWGGLTAGLPLQSGSIYDPATDTWVPTTTDNAPASRFFHTAVWTGDRMLVWGGKNNGASLGSGGTYTFQTQLPDADGDGFSCATDCDDSHPAIHPGATEVCNGVDDNCDGTTDETGDALCADTDPCSLDVCGGVAGCSHSPAADGSSCSDGNDCTESDTCQAGACVGATAPDDTPCSDSQECTSGESCHAGVCSGGAPNDLPSLSVSLSPTTLTPSNHKLIDITATVAALDACGAPLAATLVSIVSSEPDDAPGPSDGHTTGDIQGASFGTADFAFQLRAERDSKGSGRTYTVTYTTQDSAGQTQSASRAVHVPLKKNSPGPASSPTKARDQK